MANSVSISSHRALYPFTKLIFRSIRKHKLVFVNEMSECTSNAIFAVNHSCKYDTPYVCEAIGSHCYLLGGKQPLEFIDRLFFNINGIIWVDRKNKESKKKSTSNMIDLLNRKANILIFPEGTWNLTPSKPVLQLNWGIIEVSRQTSKPIIPVVLEYSDKNCYVSFGTSIFVDEADEKSVKINELTDSFATQKWLIWENFSDVGYKSEQEWSLAMKKRIDEYPKLDIEYEMSVVRGVCDTSDFVFKHLTHLQPSMDNAFLFNKRNHD